MPAQDYPGLAKKIEERFSTLKGQRSAWEQLWQEIARYVMPRRVPGMNGTVSTPSTDSESRLFDTTAIQANMTLGNGQLAWMSPLESSWFAFEPPNDTGGDDVKKWLAKASDTARNALAISNFYTSVHEFYLDRGAFGTAALYVEPSKRGGLNCQMWPVGSFVIDENSEGLVDTIIREFQLTPRQAAQEFGAENLSGKLQKLLEQGGSKASDKFWFLHAIYPREDAERDKAKLDSPNMPVASVYMEREGCHVVKVSGYEEQPFMVSRYLKWGSTIGSPYGWSPAFAALPEAKQLNFLQKMQDALAEKAAFPPVLAPEELEGEVDPNAYGVTYFSKEMVGSLPKEWMTGGRYDIGLQRIQERQKAINGFFHVDLFAMFAQLTKQMTAREVAERSQEKLIQFSPTFSRLTSELFNPLLERVFGIMLRQGKFGRLDEIPAGLVQDLGNGTGFIPPPQVQYSSRIALALKALPAIGYQRTLERVGMVAQFKPDVLDNFDFDRAERETALSDGIDPDFLVDQSKVDEQRAARAQQAAQQAQQAQAMQAADAIAKVGKVPAGTPVGKAMGAAMPGMDAI